MVEQISAWLPKFYGLQLRDAILGERYAHINFGDDEVHAVLTTVATCAIVVNLLSYERTDDKALHGKS